MTASVTELAISGDRLNDRIDRLAKIGRTAAGSVRRLAFTAEDLQARYQVQQWMVAAGMTVRTDAAGNLIGRYEGTVAQAPTLATGSHIDTVPSGGCYDGVLGVLAGIEVVETLHQNQLRLKHPVEVIVFTDEESTMVGCQAVAGTLDTGDPKQIKTAVDEPIEDCLERIGGSWDDLKTVQRSRADMAAFVELHVEQGAVLEYSRNDIGVVQGVVGIRRLAITLVGQANHAGTTPMDMRQDALVAAAEIVLAVRNLAQQMPSQPVATVGYLEVQPNAVNIVPGRVTLSVDMRDLSKDVLDEMVVRLEQQVGAIATTHNIQFEMSPLLWVEPSPAAPHIQSTIKNVCEKLGLSYCYLPSRAGHDALEMGRITDMGMIFVPSQAGISHSESEYTSPQQCIQGANVLLHTFLALDAAYPV